MLLCCIAGLNYIKGYRYELYCIVRAAGTTHCCVWVDAPQSIARKRNEERATSSSSQVSSSAVDGDKAASAPVQPYDAKVFEELWLRFEPPDPRNRWDAPMIKVDGGGGSSESDDSSASSASGEASNSAVSARLAPAFTSKFLGTVVDTPDRIKAAEAVAESVLMGNALSTAPTADTNDRVIAAAAPAVKKSAFKRAAPKAAPVTSLSDGCGGGSTGVAISSTGNSQPSYAGHDRQAGNDDSARFADATYDDGGAPPEFESSIDLDSSGPLGSDAAEEADVEAARQRLAAMRLQRANAAVAAAEGSGLSSTQSADQSTSDAAALASAQSSPEAAAFLACQPAEWAAALKSIYSAIFERRGYKAPLAVQPVKVAPPNFTQEVDVRTAAVVESLSSSLAVSGSVVGDIIAVPGSSVPFVVRRRVTPLELKRLKREVRAAPCIPLQGEDILICASPFTCMPTPGAHSKSLFPHVHLPCSFAAAQFERAASSDPSGGVDAIVSRFVGFLNVHLRD